MKNNNTLKMVVIGIAIVFIGACVKIYSNKLPAQNTNTKLEVPPARDIHNVFSSRNSGQERMLLNDAYAKYAILHPGFNDVTTYDIYLQGSYICVSIKTESGKNNEVIKYSLSEFEQIIGK